MLSRSSARYVLTLYVADILAMFAALLLARELRMAVPLGRELDVPGSTLYAPMFLLGALVWSVTLGTFHVYDPNRFAHIADELQTAILAIAAATVVLAGALYFSYRGLSRLLYVYFFLLDVFLAIVARLALRRVMGSWRSEARRRVLIVGAGSLGRQVAEALEPCAWMGISLVGFVDDDGAKAGQTILGAPVLGRVDDTREIITQSDVREVIVALPLAAHHRVANLVTALQDMSVNIKAVPDYADLVFFRATLEQFGGLLLIGLKEPVIGPIDRALKRGFDIIVAGVGLIVLAPLLLLIAAAVAATSSGPILYRSRRMADEHRVFDMLKFRTMVPGADQLQDSLIAESENGELTFRKCQDDPRVTPLGRWLRRYSLDELPQLYNVLVGDMSLVGPRPELPDLVARYEPWQRKRFGVPQGMTGWWQVSGRSNKPKYAHVEDDLYYIRNYSLLLDLRILWRTVGAVLRGEGAF